MMSIQPISVTMKTKKSDGSYVTLNPKTRVNQILGIPDKTIVEPFEVALSKDNWVKSGEYFTQTISNAEISENSQISVTNTLFGSTDEMKRQEMEYRKLQAINGVITADNAIVFTAWSKPEVDLKVTIWWVK